MKDKVFRLMGKNNFCVISTVDRNGVPEAALIGFSQNEDLEIMFGTSDQSRKFKNLQLQPRVAIVVSQPEERLTVQYEGVASQIPEAELAARLKQHFTKLPFAKKYVGEKDQVWVKIRPTWIRYSDSSQHPTAVEEVGFAA